MPESKNPKIKIARLSVRLPVEAKNEVDRMASKYGVKRGTFYSMSLSLGARHLAAQMEPEKMISPEIAEMLMKVMDKIEKE